MDTSGHRPAATALMALAGAFAVGVVLAKCIDWMGHGHPRH